MTTHKSHHTVACFHLKRFTSQGTRDGKLYVTDKKTGRQWGPQSIEDVATENGFYKLDDEEADPMAFEKMMGNEIEPALASVVDYILSTLDVPNWGLAKDTFLNLVSISFARTQIIKQVLTKSFDAVSRKIIEDALSTEERQKQFLARTPNLTVEKVRELLEGDNTKISPTPNTYLVYLLERAVDFGLPILNARRWYARQVADNVPDLITSNTPVGLVVYGPMYGRPIVPLLEPFSFVAMPLSRRVAVMGGIVGGLQPPKELSKEWVIAINRTIADQATQLYSAEKAIAI